MYWMRVLYVNQWENEYGGGEFIGLINIKPIRKPVTLIIRKYYYQTKKSALTQSRDPGSVSQFVIFTINKLRC